MADRLIGRERELTSLLALLDDAKAGRGRGALLLGDPGIGKTTLAEALATRAAKEGFAVGWGRCPDAETIPYWPWRQALRGIAPRLSVDDAALSGRPGLFAGVVEHLSRATRTMPALILIEDLHFADEASLALLRFLASAIPELPCLLVVTSRDNALDLTPEVSDLLAGLPPTFTRISLIGLDRDHTADLINQVLESATAADVEDVHRRSGGNPFFVLELARLQAVRGGSALGSPAGVEHVIGRRLARLNQRAHECLAAAAVIGDDVELTVLASVADVPVPAVLDLVKLAAEARLAVVDGTRLRFAHALVREVLYDGLAASRRSALHLRAGQALAGTCCARGRHLPTYGLPLAPCCSTERVQANAGQVADHFRRAVGQPGAEELARDHALSAARVAMKRAGYEQAVRFFRWALEGSDAPAVRLELGEAQVLTGDVSAGRETLREIARHAVAAGQGGLAASAVLAMGGRGGFEVDLSDLEQTSLLERAVALMPTGDSAVKAGSLARLALSRAHGRMQDDARALARSAVDMARRLGDPSTEATAIAAWCDTASGPDFVEERRAAAGRMLAIAEAAGDITLSLLARRLLVMALLEKGEFDAADEHIAAYAHAASQLRSPYYGWLAPVWRGMRALMRGDLAATERHLAEAQQIAGRAQSPNADLMIATLQFAMADETDTMKDVLPLVETVFGPYLEVPMAQCYLSYFLVRAGARDRARRLVESRTADGLTALAKDAEWLPSIALFGEAARQLDVRSAVEASRDAIRPYDGLWLHDGIGAGCYGPVADYLERFTEYLDGKVEAESSASTAVHTRAAIHRTGPTWELRWRGEAATVADSKGLRDLAQLLTRPRSPVHVLDLVGTTVRTTTGSGAMLDERARSAYRAKLEELEEEIAEAEDFADAGRLDKLRSERDFIAHELAAALGLGGRARTIGDPVERARKAVSMRIAAAVKAIDQVHPTLGRHLRASVRTGRQCVYEPEEDVVWSS